MPRRKGPPGLSPRVSPGVHAACDPVLLRALTDALAALPSGTAVGIALSAGADSAMLAVHATQVAADRRLALHCFHVHHGLQSAADAWLGQAHALAALLGIPCHSRFVRVVSGGRGVEAAARAARYAALADLARQAGVRHLLLAHHQSDQAETVLLRLLRGAGPQGLAAMAPHTERDGVGYLRPWLDQPRARILACADRFARQTGWVAVKDPSNLDPRYARGALRAEIVPVLDARWPAWRQILCRHAGQARAQGGLVDAWMRADWATLDPAPDGRSFSLPAWRALPAEHQGPLLRFWLRAAGQRMPTSARLDDWLRQLREVHALGHDRQLSLRHERVRITVERGRVCMNRIE